MEYYSNSFSVSLYGLCEYHAYSLKKNLELNIFYLKSLEYVELNYFECDSNMVSLLKYPHVFGFIKRIFKNCKLCVSYP